MTPSPLIFFTGKGGVGRSIVSSALAHRLSENASVLHVELAPSRFLDAIYQKTLGHTPQAITPRLSAARFNPEDSFEQFAALKIKSKTLAKHILNHPLARLLIQIAPGLRELSLMGKLVSGERGLSKNMDYDHVIIDTYSTGHFKSLIQAVLSMSERFKKGAAAEESQGFLTALKESSQFFIVTLPHLLAYEECEDLQNFIHENLTVTPHVICNQSLADQSFFENPQWAEIALGDLKQAPAVFLETTKEKIQIHERIQKLCDQHSLSLWHLPLSPSASLESLVKDLSTALNFLEGDQ